MKGLACTAFALLAAVITGCSRMQVTVNYDDSVNFTQYKTFRLVRPAPQQEDEKGAVRGRLFTREVMAEIKPLLTEKGFQEASSKENADFLVIFYGTISNQRNYAPPVYRAGRRGRVWRVRPGHVYSVKKGMLVIDIVDRGHKELIWQGTGRGVLNPHQPAADLVGSVAEILKKFPPQTDLAP